MLFSLRLRPQIIFGTLIILLLCLSITGSLFHTREKNRLNQELQTKGQSLAALVAQLCSTPIEKYSFYIIQEVALNVEKNEGIAFCEIYDAKGKSLVQIDTTIRGEKIHKKPRITGDDILITKHPITKNGKPLGLVEIGLDRAQIESELRKQIIGLISSSFILLVLVAILINIYLSFYFITPVVHLSGLIKDIARGVFVKTRAAGRNDEIGELARGFNEMSINLQQLYSNLERKVNERTEDLEEANRQLQSEIRVRKKTEKKLKLAKETAEQANQYKSNFVANMSHEIRTPLNAILGYAQILQTRNNLNESDIKALEAIDRGGSHLLGLINDILDLSKIEAGKIELNPAPFDLALLIRNMASMFQLRCSEKSLTWQVVGIDTNDVIPVFADSGKLRQIMINLLGNAVKFTEKGSVLLRLTKNDQNFYRFCIEDTGRGIPFEAREVIFTPFSNISGQSGKEGTGLGLSISRSFLEMMNSRLEVLNNSPQGTRFCFELYLPPLEILDLPEEPQHSSIIGLKSDKQITALIVDDDKLSRAMLTHLLNKTGIDTEEAKDGIEALKCLDQNIPDIILMDRYMPQMDGPETIKMIHTKLGKNSPPVVMITAAAFETEKDTAEELGLAGIIIKPCEIGQVLQSMAQALDLSLEYSEKKLQNPQQDKEMDFELSRIVLPEDIITRIQNAAEFGKISELKKITEEINTLTPENKLFVSYLKKQIEKYRLTEILHMMAEMNETIQQ